MRNVTLVQVKINGTEYFRKTISATGSLDVNVLYLGGMPQMGRTIRQVEAIPNRSEITKIPVNFKGIIQDVQVTYRMCSVCLLDVRYKKTTTEIVLSFITD